MGNLDGGESVKRAGLNLLGNVGSELLGEVLDPSLLAPKAEDFLPETTLAIYWQVGYSDDQIVQSFLDGANRNVIPNNPSVTGHIFRVKEGHLSVDTPENRALLEAVAGDPAHLRGTTMYGMRGYSKTLPDGTQVWVEVNGSTIINGGVDSGIRPWNERTGFKSPTRRDRP